MSNFIKTPTGFFITLFLETYIQKDNFDLPKKKDKCIWKKIIVTQK